MQYKKLNGTLNTAFSRYQKRWEENAVSAVYRIESYRRTSKKVDKIRKCTDRIETSRNISISSPIKGWKMVAVGGKYQNKIETTRLNCVHNYKENDF